MLSRAPQIKSTTLTEGQHMKVLLYGGLALTVLGFLSQVPAMAGIGIVGILAFITIKFLGWGTRTASSAVSTALSDRRSEKHFQTNLRREVQRERELSAVRNEGMIALLCAQVELIAKHKREGADVEREVIEMRKKLLDYEATENKAMIGELISTLDRL
jgi:flagellar biosynthesis component FlhA